MATIRELFPGTQLSPVEREVLLEDDFSTLIIHSSIDGIMAFDRDTAYTIWNPAMERITGMKAESVIGKRALEVFPFLVEIGRDRCYRDVLEGRSSRGEEAPIPHAVTGRISYVETFMSPLKDEFGQIVGGLGVIRDVSERRSMDDELRKLNSALDAAVRACTDEARFARGALAREMIERRHAERAMRFLSETGNILLGDAANSFGPVCAAASAYFESWCAIHSLEGDIPRLLALSHPRPEVEDRLRATGIVSMVLPGTAHDPVTIGRQPGPVLAREASPMELFGAASSRQAFNSLRGAGFRSYIHVPLKASGGMPLGALSIVSGTRSLGEQELRISADLGAQLSLALRTPAVS